MFVFVFINYKIISNNLKKINLMPTTNNEQETHALAKDMAKNHSPGKIICLFGDLGSGKTTFTKGLAEGFGINKLNIKSPTYTYIREHKTEKGNNFLHIDLYRLNQIDDLLLDEINELAEDKNNIIIIEWGDRMGNKLPINRTEIYFEYIDENKRNITIK